MGAGKKLNKKFRLYYDKEQDILYVATKGIEENYVEVASGLNVEFDEGGNIIGIELLRASRLLKEDQEPAKKRIRNAAK